MSYHRSNGIFTSKTQARIKRQIAAGRKASEEYHNSKKQPANEKEHPDMTDIQIAIGALQVALSKLYGKDVPTDCGKATLFISHDRVELTDQSGTIVAEDAAEARHLLEL